MEIDPHGRSAHEIEELWRYISDRLEKNFRRTVFAAPNQPVAGFPNRAAGSSFGRRGVIQ
jgi:chromosome partitioning protein